MKHPLEASEPSLFTGPAAARPGELRTTPGARVAMVVLALVWTQFPLGGGARAEGGRQVALCCAWGKALDDRQLTYSVVSADDASAAVIRQAVWEWDASLPGLALAERAVGSTVDIAMAFDPEPGRTEGQAVTTFTPRGLIRHVDVSIQGGQAPDNAGSLLQIAKHEFGHALGLGHANFEGNLMSKAVSPHPQPIEPCVISGVLEANRWRLGDVGLRQVRRPAEPLLSDVAC